jgi:uncharacterized repeat protein (TIGR01451 family)
MPALRLLALAAAVSGAAVAALAAEPTRVTNTATLSVATPAGRASVASNTVSLDVQRTKSPTTLSFRLLPVGYRLEGMACETQPSPRFTPAPIDAATLAQAPRLETLDVHTPLILVLENQGGNRDPAVRETSWINVSTETFQGKIPLLETGPDTGVFAGGVPEGGSYPEFAACDPTLVRGARITLSFTEDDYSYGSSNSELIDPAGEVFDSATGALVDGAEVTLLDEQDRPARVFGDDGTSAYPSTVVSGADATDTSGRRYDFSQGNYRFPQVAAGRYHLRIVPPAGYSAPSTRDRAALAALRDPSGQPYILNDASFGGSFVLSRPDPFYADVPLDRAGDTRLLITKTASVREASPGDFVQYRVTVENRSGSPAIGVRLTDILPRGLRFQRGSERGAAAPEVSEDGRTLAFAVPTIAADATAEVRYLVSVAPGAPVGEAVNRVLASGGGGVTGNEAAASVRIRPLLFTDGFTVIGRVTEGACGDPVDRRKGVPGVRLLLEDGTFVVTDRDGLYHFEGVRPGRHVVQLDAATVPASHAPVACDSDTRQAGNPLSRFVEADGGLLKRVDFQLRPTGKAAAAAPALPVTVADDATAAGGGARDWFAGEQPGTAFLFPLADHNPRAPAVRVVVKHRPGQRVALTVNGRPTDPLAFDATDTNQAGTIAVSRWTGVPLADGDNRLEARILDADGRVAGTLTRVVHLSGAPAEAVLAPAQSRLAADGLTPPAVAIRLTDRAGRPVKAGTVVPVQIAAPYAAAVDRGLEQSRKADGDARAGGAVARVVGDDGLAFVTLQPTSQSGALRLSVEIGDENVRRAVELRAWLAPAARQWTVVGFGAGTLGYDVLSKHRRGLPAGAGDGVVTDGQLALYAKGRIKGEWLLTLAYDSDRRRDRSRGLLGTIDPDRYYTVYGDGTRQGYDAPTAGKLYLRLERRAFYALFGDYETGLTDTRLGRYSRTLNGGKAAWEGRQAAATAFVAHTDERYARDEIPGNGLTGPYRLSVRDIVPNSDKLRIEVRDRFRSELILSTTAMTRHIDYDIDPVAGTVRFRAPVLTRDANRNPIVIVVDYETYGRGRKLVAGARAVARLAGDRVEVGTTALRDETAGRATVLAVDAKARIGRTTQLRGEAAAGGRGGIGSAHAWLVEAEHHGARVDVVAYARQQDLGFGVGQQNIVEAGTRKFGLDGRVQLTDRLSLTGTAWHQQYLVTGAERTAADVRLEWRRATGTLFAGAQLAMDRGLDGADRDSRLLTLGGSQALFGGKLTLSGQTQVAPGGDADSVDFPVRHQLTAAWRVTPAVRLIGGYEIADGQGFTTQTAQVGFDVAPWRGAKLSGTVNQQGAAPLGAGENGERVFAQYGLSQSLPLGKRWSVDATLDASSTLSGRLPAGAAVAAFQPIGGTGGVDPTVGGDYLAVTLGAGYRADRWSWNGRAEYRTGEGARRLGLTSNLLRSLGEGKTLASALRWYEVRDAAGRVARYATADLSLAWRPLDSRWSVLSRVELRRERADAGLTDANVIGVPAYGGGFQATLRAVGNVAVNYRTGPEGAGHGLEATVYYGAKWVRGSFGADDYAGYTDVTGFELRRDIGQRFDLGVQGSVQHGWSSGTWAFSGGPTAGVSPAKDVWVTAGYNIAGYRDRDFSADRYTRQGPFVTLRLKFDQAGIGQALRAIGGRR